MRAVVQTALYPPLRKRGNGTLVARASGYGLLAQGYDSRCNNEAFIGVVIESREGASNAGAIVAVDRIDAVVAGVFDLSADLGVTAQFDHPDFVAVMRYLENAVAAEGKTLGTVLYPGTTLPDLLKRGHRFNTLSADTLLLGRAMREQLAGGRG